MSIFRLNNFQIQIQLTVIMIIQWWNLPQSVVGNSKNTHLRLGSCIYNLLAKQVPVSRITYIIQIFLIWPKILNGLQWLKMSCESYMSSEEPRTVCDAHKATAICEDSQLRRITVWDSLLSDCSYTEIFLVCQALTLCALVWYCIDRLEIIVFICH